VEIFTSYKLMFSAPMAKEHDASGSTIVLDLKVGKVPVSFRGEANGTFEVMRQVAPSFGPVHDRNVVAEALGLNAAEIEPDLPFRTAQRYDGPGQRSMVRLVGSSCRAEMWILPSNGKPTFCAGVLSRA
jgi:hypothetical protein